MNETNTQSNEKRTLNLQILQDIVQLMNKAKEDLEKALKEDLITMVKSLGGNLELETKIMVNGLPTHIIVSNDIFIFAGKNLSKFAIIVNAGERENMIMTFAWIKDSLLTSDILNVNFTH